MKTITVQSAPLPSGQWVAFREGADLSQYDESKIVPWAFDSEEPTPGSLIRANDRVVEFGIRRDASGRYVEAAYEGAYRLAFALEHLRRIAGPQGEVEAPSRKQVEAVPPPVLAAYVALADTSRGVAASDLDFLRRPSGGGAA